MKIFMKNRTHKTKQLSSWGGKDWWHLQGTTPYSPCPSLCWWTQEVSFLIEKKTSVIYIWICTKVFMSFSGGWVSRAYCREHLLFLSARILPNLPGGTNPPCVISSEFWWGCYSTVSPPWLYGWLCNQGLATHVLYLLLTTLIDLWMDTWPEPGQLASFPTTLFADGKSKKASLSPGITSWDDWRLALSLVMLSPPPPAYGGCTRVIGEIRLKHWEKQGEKIETKMRMSVREKWWLWTPRSRHSWSTSVKVRVSTLGFLPEANSIWVLFYYLYPKVLTNMGSKAWRKATALYFSTIDSPAKT